MRNNNTILLALLLAGATSAGAQESLDINRGVRLALENNLYMKLARAGGEAGRADALSAASRLLPQVEFSVSQSRTFSENLTAMGFGRDPYTGGIYMLPPFSSFDARLSLVLTVLDLQAAAAARSKEELRRAAELRVELAAEQVSAAAALAYLEVLRSSAAVNSASSGLELAASLRALAENRHEAGTATGLDVLRARTREAEERMRVSRAGTALKEAGLRLEHMLGLPLGAGVKLTETLSPATYAVPQPAEAVRDALAGRLELRIARAEFAAGENALKAAKGARLPSVAVTGDAALSGNVPDHNDKLTGAMAVGLKLPLYAGGRVDAGVKAAGAARSRAEGLLEDASAQVQEETLSALERLKASSDEVATASMTVTMAEQELYMTRNRFAAGVGDNVELVNAQTSLSRARDSFVDAMSRAKEANIRLTLALGRMKDLKF